MTKFFSLTLAFIITTQVGAILTEVVKKYTAHHLNYKTYYDHRYGRSFFYSPQMQSEFESVEKKYENNVKNYRASTKWNALVAKDTADFVRIELSGKLFICLVSAIGLAIFFYRRNKKYNLSWKDWVAVLLGLFFMRDVVINSFDIIADSMICNEAKLWDPLQLPFLLPVKIFVLLGLTLLCFVIYKIPKNYRMTFIISGIAGSVSGCYAWLYFTGEFLFRST